MAPKSLMLYSDGHVFAGAERYLLELSRGLPKDHYDISLVCSHDGGLDPFAAEAKELGLKVHRLPPIPTLSSRRALLKVARFFVTHRSDILHFNLADPRSCNGAMTAARAALRSGFVVTEHLPMSQFDDKPLPFRHRLAAKSTALTIVHTETNKSIVENRPHHRGRVAVVPNGVPDLGPPNPERREAARRTLGFPEDPRPIVGWVGRFQPQKDPTLMVEGIRRAVEQHPDAQFCLIGDGELFHEVEALVQSLELGGQVRLFGQRDDARELMYGFDLFAMSSVFEGMPLVVLEAMAAGVAVLGTAIPGMYDLVAENASGRLVPPQDGDVFGAALIDLLHRREQLPTLGKVGRQRMLTLFSLESMCERTHRLYQELS